MPIRSIVRLVLVRPLPFQDPDRLVLIWHRIAVVHEKIGVSRLD